MKLHSMIIAGGAGLLLLGACSPSSYQTTFPEPAYVKVSTNNGAYAPYPDDPVGQQELVYWYNSLAAPMTVVAEVPPTPIVTTGSGPVVLDSSDFSAKLYRDRTEIKKKDKDGNWVTSVRPTTPADQRMRNYVMASKKARSIFPPLTKDLSGLRSSPEEAGPACLRADFSSHSSGQVGRRRIIFPGQGK